MSNLSRGALVEVDERLARVFGVPRRRHKDPVSQLIVTILSQATTDTQTERSFDKLRRRFAAWEQVRDAPASAIAHQIRASGLARQKAPRIKAALEHITRERGALELDFLGKLPVDEAYRWLLRIKGVGPKTASIVLLFTFRKPFFPVDTHIHRITRRLGWIPHKTSAARAHQLLLPIIPPGAHYRLHVNLIRFGREICVARMPHCEVCPLTDLCDYFQTIHKSAGAGSRR